MVIIIGHFGQRVIQALIHISKDPESVIPIEEKPWKIVVTFTKGTPDQPITADVSLIGCFKPGKIIYELWEA